MSPFDSSHIAFSDSFTRPISLPRGTSLGNSGSWQSLAGLERRALLERALDSIWLVFQPIVSQSRAGEPVFAYEALARNAERSVANPSDLVDLAMSLGMIGELGRVVRTRAAGVLRRRRDMTLFVNVDVEELMTSLGDEDDPLAEFAQRVVLEVTERAPISELPEVRERSTALRQRGYRFAIDDLGGGYAGLSSLAVMDPDFVKIDQALIRNVDTQPIKRKIVGSLASLCRQLGIGCIVEGVETVPERDALAALDCDLMQGFLFGRPATI